MAVSAVSPVYPVEVTSCDGYKAPGEEPECSFGNTLHPPITVVLNGFSYQPEDMGRQVLDASVNYRASPLLIGIFSGWLVALWLISAPVLESLDRHTDRDIL